MRWVFVAVLILAFPRWSTAEINMADSIEWMTADSDRVVVGKVAKRTTKTEGTDTWHFATIAVSQTLKGTPTKTVELVVRGSWKTPGKDVLLFLIGSNRRALLDGDQPPAARYADAPFAIRPDRWGERAVLELDGSATAFTIDHAVLRTRTELVARIKAVAGSNATRAMQIDLPIDSPAGRVLYGGSAVVLYVPIDAALEQRAIQWLGAAAGTTREQGVQALSHFRSATNIARLENLLADPATHDVTEGANPTVRRYFVRKRVHEVLRAWGHPHRVPLIDEVPNP